MFLFFSSRRRHTRYIGDWSSDVCSSDLRSPSATSIKCSAWSGSAVSSMRRRISLRLRKRSEERRVGKEGRYRGAPHHEQNEDDTVKARAIEPRLNNAACQDDISVHRTQL